MSYILAIFSETPSGSKSAPPEQIKWTNFIKDAETLTFRGKRFGETPVREIVAKWPMNENAWWPASKDTTLFSQISTLQRGVHRVPVLDEKGTVIDIVSQVCSCILLSYHVLFDHA